MISDAPCSGSPRGERCLNVEGSDESGCPRGRTCVEDRAEIRDRTGVKLLNPPAVVGPAGLAGSKGRCH
jgi:hypothetical protein